jgi:hypothetical protein
MHVVAQQAMASSHIRQSTVVLSMPCTVLGHRQTTRAYASPGDQAASAAAALQQTDRCGPQKRLVLRLVLLTAVVLLIRRRLHVRLLAVVVEGAGSRLPEARAYTCWCPVVCCGY